MTLLNIVVSLLAVAVLVALALAGFTWWTARKVQAALRPQGGFIDAGGTRFHVVDKGEGPVLLLIHGLMGQSRHFSYGVVDSLAASHRVIVIDRPGSGYSPQPGKTPADLSTQATAVARLLRHMQAAPAIVVGHSLGGALALALALAHPDCVSGCVLIAPLSHLRADAGVPAAFRALTIRPAWLRQLFAWTLAVPSAIARSGAVLAEVFGPESVPPDFAVRGGGLIGLCPHQFLAGSRDLQALPECLPALSARYAELRLPVRVLFGRADQILDWRENGQALVDKLADGELTLVDGGHMLPVTQPQATAGFILAAARGIAARAAAVAGPAAS
jgi:pimeloyl-ACP methyl ester carboxylesterase